MTDEDIASDAAETAWAASCGFTSAAEYHAESRDAFIVEQDEIDHGVWYQGDPE